MGFCQKLAKFCNVRDLELNQGVFIHTVTPHEERYQLYSEGNFLADSRRCLPFDRLSLLYYTTGDHTQYFQDGVEY